MDQESAKVTKELPSKLSSGQRKLITAGVMTGMFLAALEATVVGTAMPTVIASLGGLAHYSWVFSAYLLTATVSVPLWGKLSDLYGRRKVYQIGIAVFLAGSILSGIARSMFQLIAFRGIQGLGAGALVPIAMTIIGDIYTLEERARMQALFSGVWGLASIVGPILGGFLTDQLSWRWVFFINIPFGLASALIIGASLKEQKLFQHPSIDYAGAATLTTAVVLLMLALVESGSVSTLLSVRNLILIAAATILFAIFIRIERKAKEPVIPLDLFKNKVVKLSIIGGFLIGFGMFGAISFIPLYAQGTRGATATEAGSLLTPLMLSWVTMSIVGGRLLLHVGYRATVVAGCAILTAAFVILSTFTSNTHGSLLYLDLILIGAGLGLTMLTLLIAVQQAVQRQVLGTATSLNQFSRSIGGAIGVAIMGAILSSSLYGNLMERASQPGSVMTREDATRLAANPSALIDPSAKSSLNLSVLHELQSALSDALQNVFILCAIIAAAALMIVFRLPSKITPASAQIPKPPPAKACDAESGERLVIAELATIDPDNEPVVVDDE